MSVERAVESLQAITGADPVTNQVLLALEAQAQATLALVAEQHTANLIAYLSLDERRNGFDYSSSQVDALIRKGLGL